MTRMGLRYLNRKRGFTLNELIIVMVILSILAGIIIISIGGVVSTAYDRAYEEGKDQIQVAVGDFMTRNNGYLPITGGVITIGGINYRIIDMCVLQKTYNGTSGSGMLLEIPVSCVNTTDDNCDNAACEVNIASYAGSCSPLAHYVWAVTPGGDVKSACVGTDCDASNTDGYQGVYP
jgi:prepilin-type N-terminal cleavage/methylation domain-containing protein